MPRRGGNLTYVRVHKCGEMLIQSAMYVSAHAVRANAAGRTPRAVPGCGPSSIPSGAVCARGGNFGTRSVRIMSNNCRCAVAAVIVVVVPPDIHHHVQSFQEIFIGNLHYNVRLRARCLFEDD